jgi:hypothetical protein
MLRLASLVVVGAMAPTAWAAPKGGKVVRVERDRGWKTIPRICEIQATGKEGLCVGEPKPGERVALVDQDQDTKTDKPAVGEFRIDSSTIDTDRYACPGATPVVFAVKGALTRGATTLFDTGRIIGLRNLRLDPKATRVVKDPKVPGSEDRADLALDLDGNGSTDYMLVRYGCDEYNNRTTTMDARICFDTYLDRGKGLEKAHTENIQLCY